MMQRFGEKLRMLRTKRSMTVRELTQALGYTNYGYIGQLERGEKKPTGEMILNVAQLFKVSTDQLLWDELEVDEE